MSANQVASSIARQHGYGYHEVRVAINRLANSGMIRADAERHVARWAADGENLADAATRELQARGARG
jgi:predicted transcriptional regulator